MTPEGWVYEDPIEPGWYATLTCWDTAEGIFPGADQWDGKRWTRGRGPTAYTGPFPDQPEALRWARAHNPET